MHPWHAGLQAGRRVALAVLSVLALLAVAWGASFVAQARVLYPITALIGVRSS